MALMIVMALAGAILCGSPAVAEPRQQSRAGAEAVPPTDMNAWLKRLVGKYRVEGMLQVVYPDPDYDRHRCGQLPPGPGESPPEPYCRAIKGAVDCIGIGPGPGVQCMLNVTWPDLYEVVAPEPEAIQATTREFPPTGVFELPGGVSNLSPAMALFGVDPGNSGIRYLLVDHKGLPEGGPGFLTGNRARLATSCVNTPNLLNAMKLKNIENRATKDCDRIIYLDAKPDSRVVIMSVDIEINGVLFTSLQMTLRRESDAPPAQGQ